MKITNEQLKQIIKEELEAVIGEEATAESGDQIKQQAKRELAQYYNNYINTEAPASGPDRMNFVRDWLSGWEDGKREWTSWWPLYNAWRTSSTGPKGISPEELIPLTVEALTPVVVRILQDSNASRYYNEQNVRKFLQDAHTHGKPS